MLARAEDRMDAVEAADRLRSPLPGSRLLQGMAVS